MKKGSTILIVDDNTTNVQVAVGILEKNGFDTEYALHARGAFSWLTQKSFDLILMDVMMPEMDGFEACREIKKNPEWEEIPVIFLTARTDRQSLLKGFESGGADYITKPFDVRELLMRVQTHIELKQSRSELKQVNESLEKLLESKEMALQHSAIDLVSANEALLIKNRELEKVEEGRQNFFRVLGSEVGNSLHDVTSMLQVIKLRVDSRKVAQMIDRIDHSLVSLENIVSTAIRITELQTPGKHISAERIDLSRMIGFTLFELDEKIRRRQIVFKNHLAPESAYIIGETRLIKSGLLILFDYCIERNEPNSVITIDYELKGDSGWVIQISDNGAGLTGEEQERAFNYFNIGSQSLSLARLIAVSHHGDLRIVPEKGGGNRYEFSLYHVPGKKETRKEERDRIIDN